MSDHDENNGKHERFGRYLILDHLVDGGMAKICRARFLGEQADKVVAIKMIQPQYSRDESFKTMFMDEIKLTFGLIHPNIVQTYDYGFQKGQLYVAMEYCDGRNLKEYLDKLRERKFVFPVEISVYIMTQVCQGLHYAHTFTDKLTGKDASIIHRDISPHNVMLTYDGAIKIIDFGIAKSENNSEATQAGTIKGKLSYLAPEYLEGHQLDARYDEFAVGITLWEMLCSRKLFKAANDLAVLKKIQECKVPPPSSINPNVPKELDEIVLKALSKDRNKRFENLEQLNRALIKFLYTNYPDFNATDLSYFAKELFKQEIKKDRERLFEFGKIDLRPYLNDLRQELEGGTSSSQGQSSQFAGETEAERRAREQELDFGFDSEANEAKIRVSQMRTSTNSKSKGKKKAKKLPKKDSVSERMKNMVEDGAELSLKDKDEDEESDKNTRTVTKSARKNQNETKNLKLKKKGKTGTVTQYANINISSNNDKRKKILAASVAIFLLFFFFVLPEQSPERDPAGQEIGSDISSESALENEKSNENFKGSFRLANFDKFRQRVFINGVEKETDIIGIVKAPIGENIVVRVQQPGRKHFVTEINVEEGQELVVHVPTMPPANFGFLEMGRDCSKGKIFFEIYGEKRVEQLPLPSRGRIAFPVSSSGQSNHQIFYQKEGEDIQRPVVVSFSDGRTTDLCKYIR